MDTKEVFLAQLDHVLVSYEHIAQITEYNDFSDIKYDVYGHFHASAIAVINRVSGSNSIYAKEANNLLFTDNYERNNRNIPVLAGIVKALKDDVQQGFLSSARELIHGELFGDFLEMADFLVEEGYKDAAAVIG